MMIHFLIGTENIVSGTTVLNLARIFENTRVMVNGIPEKNFIISEQTTTLTINRSLALEDSVEVFETIRNIQDFEANVVNLRENLYQTRVFGIVLYKNLQYDLYENKSDPSLLGNYIEALFRAYGKDTLGIELRLEDFIQTFSERVIYGDLFSLPEGVNQEDHFLAMTDADVINFVGVTLLSANYETNMERAGRYSFLLRDASNSNLGLISTSENRPNSVAFRKIKLGTKEILLTTTPLNQTYEEQYSQKARGTYILDQNVIRRVEGVFKGITHFYSEKNVFFASTQEAKNSHEILETEDSKDLHKEGQDVYEGGEVAETSYEDAFRKNVINFNEATDKIKKVAQSVPLIQIGFSISDVNNLRQINAPYILPDLTNFQGYPETLDLSLSREGFVVIQFQVPFSPQWVQGMFLRLNELFYHSDFHSFFRGSKSDNYYFAERVSLEKGFTLEGNVLTLQYMTPGILQEPEVSSLVIDLADSSSTKEGVVWMNTSNGVKKISLNSGENVVNRILSGAVPESYEYISIITDIAENNLQNLLSHDRITFISKERLKVGEYSLSLNIDPKKDGKGERRETFQGFEQIAVDLESFATSLGELDLLSAVRFENSNVTLTFNKAEMGESFFGLKIIKEGSPNIFLNEHNTQVIHNGEEVQVNGDFQDASSVVRLLLYFRRGLNDQKI